MAPRTSQWLQERAYDAPTKGLLWHPAAPHLAHPEGCAALRIVPLTAPRVSHSCEHSPDEFDLRLLQPHTPHPQVPDGEAREVIRAQAMQILRQASPPVSHIYWGVGFWVYGLGFRVEDS